VNSRFQQHDKNLTALGEARLELFETFCLPSMVHQTIQPYPSKGNASSSEPQRYRFIWIIKVDPKLDLKLRNRMVQLLKPYPNFYLVGSNKNNGVLLGKGSWRSGEAGNDVLYANEVGPLGKDNAVLSQNIYTGDVSILQVAHGQRDEKIILETRLDADDGLPVNYLESIQESAVKYLSSTSLLSDNNDKLKWMFWCIPNSYDWHPTDVVSTLDSTSSRASNDAGLVTKLKYDLCLTPGLTSGISVGVLASEVPRYAHHLIMKELRGNKNKKTNICGKRKTGQFCIQVFDKVYAIRARTPTSDGMSGVDMLSANKGEEIKWNDLFNIFGIQENRVMIANRHIDTNLISILKDNLAGQCTHLKGKPCEASKMAVQKMIDKAVKARKNRAAEKVSIKQ
jgi:hypothetical protein